MPTHAANNPARFLAAILGGLLPLCSARAATPAAPGTTKPSDSSLVVGALVGSSELTYAEARELETVLKLTISEEEFAKYRKSDGFDRAWEYLGFEGGSGFSEVDGGEVDREIAATWTKKEAQPKLAAFYAWSSPHVLLFVRPASGPDDRPLYVLAIRGTRLWSDWVINAAGALGFVPPFYSKVDALVNALLGYVGKRHGILVLTGHSLGGGIAEYAAARNGLVAITFNSAHLSQPFVPNDRAAIYTYHITGARWWNNLISSDWVNGLRLGGNFEQTRLISVPVGQGLVLRPHGVKHFYEWQEVGTEKRPVDSPIAEGRTVPRSDLLQFGPNLVAEVPAILQDAIRRAHVDRSPAFDDAPRWELPDVWDFKFRAGYLHDSRPAGGLPWEGLRVLDPPASAATAADSARTWEFQTSFSHPYTQKVAIDVNVSHRSFNYLNRLSPDFSTTDGRVGMLFAQSLHTTYAVAALVRQFKSDGGNDGLLTGIEFGHTREEGTVGQYGQKTLLWWDSSVSALRRAGVSGANGTVTDLNLGGRRIVHVSPNRRQSTAMQVRLYGGERTANDKRYANSQWGGGAGLTLQGQGFRMFAEPSMRWTRYNLAPTAANGHSDQDFIFRAEFASEIRGRIGDFRYMGWEQAIGWVFIRSTGGGGYTRQLLSAQLSKRF